MIKCLACVTDVSVIFGSYDKFVYAVTIETGRLVFKTEMSARCSVTRYWKKK